MINEVLPEQRANGVPRDDRNEDVRHKDRKNQQKSPTHLSRFPLIGMYAFPVRRCRHILYGAASILRITSAIARNRSRTA